MALQEARDLAAPEFHSMFGLLRRRPRTAATTEFAAALDTLNIPQSRAAKIFHVSARHIRRWRSGARCPPPSVAVVVRLMLMGKVKIADVEQAAVPAPAQTNDSAPAPLEEAPAALVRVEAATSADQGLAAPWFSLLRQSGGGAAVLRTASQRGLPSAADWQRTWRLRRIRRAWASTAPAAGACARSPFDPRRVFCYRCLAPAESPV